MAAQNVQVELYLSGAWTAQTPIAQRVFVDDGIEILKGFDTDGSTRPAKISLTFNNDTGSYDPDNPTSPLYGLAGRNTPIRVFVGGLEQLRAEVSSYAPDATIDHVPGANRGRAETPIVAEGILRRLGRWTDDIRSPMYTRFSTRANVVAFWPLEDGPDATQLSNTVSGGRAGFASGVTFAADGPQGSAQAVKLSATSAMSGYFGNNSATNAGWQISFAMKLNALPTPALTYYPMFQWATTNGYRWTWYAENGGYKIEVVQRDGTVLYSQGTSAGAGALPNQWIMFRIKCTASGGNIVIEPAWYAQGFTTTYGIASAPLAGTTGALYSWTVLGSATLQDATISQILGVTTATPNLLDASNLAAFNGYNGESAWDRFDRLCQQFGVQHYTAGSVTPSAAMGPQRPGRFLEQLEEAARTDDAIIYDEPYDLALTYMGRAARYNQTVALALNYPADVGPPLRKVLDDALTVNSVTVKNTRGGDATAIRTTGPMSVLPPPAGVGEYKGGDVEINAATDAALPYRAGWELAKGTIPGARYPIVRVDLLANPGLIAAAQAVSPGKIITITGKTPEVITLEVVGIKQTTGHTTRAIEYACRPADVWFPARYDNTTKRYDSRATTLNAGVTTTATAWTVTYPTLSDGWTVKPASWPFDLLVAGERVRVTAVGAVTGTGPYTQTMTVTRSINGVIKAQTATTEIHVADVARYAL